MPLYAQLTRAIQFAIATGKLRVGEQLPTVRQLAVELRVNANTVAKVYAELERSGVLEELHPREVVHVHHDLPDALYSLGLAYAKLGNTAAALAQCETLSVLDSDKARELRDEIGA